MAGETNITLVGNLTADPELRFTPSGAAVANFTVASTPRTFDRQTSEWKDGDAMFLNCSVWRQAAENVAESLTKGMRVVVSGRLKSRSYETREGERRTVFEVEVEEVGPALKYATAKVTRNTGGGNYSGGGSSGGYSGGGNAGGGNAGGNSGGNAGGNDAWSSGGGGNSNRSSGNDPWAQAQSEEPPF
ncbi:MAG: single-stranded DNA-binding protein [Micropruina sp.]|nr:single-stranded DNA-binding protein [Micropruina sp.]